MSTTSGNRDTKLFQSITPTEGGKGGKNDHFLLEEDMIVTMADRSTPRSPPQEGVRNSASEMDMITSPTNRVTVESSNHNEDPGTAVVSKNNSGSSKRDGQAKQSDDSDSPDRTLNQQTMYNLMQSEESECSKAATKNKKAKGQTVNQRGNKENQASISASTMGGSRTVQQANSPLR